MSQNRFQAYLLLGFVIILGLLIGLTLRHPITIEPAPVSINPLMYDPPPLNTCWQELGVLAVRDGIEPLLPAPKPNDTWRFVTALLLREENDGKFMIEYQFERSTQTIFNCSEAFDDVAVSP
jgi:hypothetical protein